MPRYFFHTADGSRQRDEEGTELRDQQAARTEAVRFAGALMGDRPDMLWDGHDFRVEVTDEAKHLLFTVITLVVDAPASEGAV